MARVQRTALSCILLDLSMPGINGYETLALMQELGLKIPIFALTASALSTERSKALAAGFHGFYTKPLSFEYFPEQLAAQLPPLPGAAPAQVSSASYDELRTRFLERLPQREARLREALAQKDSLGLRREAHSLAGTADQYGYQALAAAARNLEGLCDDEKLDPAADASWLKLLDQIQAVLNIQT